jgi:hypothetical protein
VTAKAAHLIRGKDVLLSRGLLLLTPLGQPTAPGQQHGAERGRRRCGLGLRRGLGRLDPRHSDSRHSDSRHSDSGHSDSGDDPERDGQGLQRSQQGNQSPNRRAARATTGATKGQRKQHWIRS